jgi:hypothetical protein
MAETIGLDQVDLLVEPHPVHRHQRIMAGVRRTAQCVFDENDAKADVDGVQHGRQHTDIGFSSRNDNGTNVPFYEEMGERRAKKP